jgi:hypothetical protein
MTKPAFTDDQFVLLFRELKSPAKVAAKVGSSVRAVYNRRRKIEAERNIVLTVDDPRSPTPVVVDAAKMTDELRELKTRLAAAEKASLSDEYVKRKIIGLLEKSVEPPNWLNAPRQAKGGAMVPTLMLSDLHWSERVFANQVNGVNEYNITIAQRRFRNTIESAVDLCKNHIVSPGYPGIVLALGGDMLSGDIHEELSESNEVPSMVALLDLQGCLQWGISRLADEFGRVFVPGVTGNHGRNTRKPRAKNRNYSNFDWLLYQFLAKHFEGDKRVQFYIPDGSDAHWSVFGHRYCMTHGDQFRGGDGMIGALGPIIRGDHKKRSRNGQIDLPYDTLLLGHWHQLIQLQRLIVNGSMKGYDEYAASGNFGFELPQQALWLTHERRGITFSMPVHCEERKRPVDREWLKFAA